MKNDTMEPVHSLTRYESDFGVFSNLRNDIPAGIAVFLVAVPLCLGIALASGAPLYSGLIAGIIGGLVVPIISRSALGVSGPAAGLAVIVLTSIQELGFEAFLLAVVIAGILQAGLGIVKAGIIGYFFPSSVITGMLSGIGIIIFLKQVPHALGYDKDYEGDLSFSQADGFNTFSELTHMLSYISYGALIIAIISLAILILWERPFVKNNKFLRILPGSLVAVATGIFISQFLPMFNASLALEAKHIVSIPVAQSASDLLDQLSFPDFSQVDNPQVYITAITMAIVASLETLLCVEAADKLDKHKRITPTNRELVAQGLANSASGIIGGLPITQVIVRSSANIHAGAKTKAAAFIHGLLLLISVILLPTVINLIPLASLAAILLVTGYKLAKPELFVTMYKTGAYHFIPFVATILGLVFTDLLTGIGIGMVIALFCILLENYKTSGYYHEEHDEKTTVIRLSEQVTFLNKANILQTLDQLPSHSKVIIDASKSMYIDYDVYEIIMNFKTEAEYKDIDLEIINLSGYGSLEPAVNSENKSTYAGSPTSAS